MIDTFQLLPRIPVTHTHDTHHFTYSGSVYGAATALNSVLAFRRLLRLGDRVGERDGEACLSVLRRRLPRAIT